MKGACEGCKFWDSFSWACCNGNSPYRADFVNEGCDFKEEEKMQIKIKKLSETAKMPAKSSDGSAGFDLYLDEEMTQYLTPGKTHMFHTNIALEIPKGYFGAIFARSGLSSKHGIRPATCVSVIDSDYRGEIGVPLHNDNKEESYKIEPHERVAQLVILPIPEVELVETDTLEETERGNGGFGSSGR